MVVLCFYTALISYLTTFPSINKDTYLLLASLNDKNFPKIFIPVVFKVADDSIANIVFTHSYKTAFPEFLLPAVYVATYYKIYKNIFHL